MPTDKPTENKAIKILLPDDIIYPSQIFQLKKQLGLFGLLKKIVPCHIESATNKMRIMFGGRNCEHFNFICEFINLGLITKGDYGSINLDNDKVNAYLAKINELISDFRQKQSRTGFEYEKM